MPVATLEFSSLCLANALHMLNDAESQATKKLAEELGESGVAAAGNLQDKILVPVPPSLPMKPEEVAQLRWVRVLVFTFYHPEINSEKMCGESTESAGVGV